MYVLARKCLQIRNRWRAKAFFFPWLIAQRAGLQSDVMIDSKHDDLEQAKCVECFRLTWYNFSRITIIRACSPNSLK